MSDGRTFVIDEVHLLVSMRIDDNSPGGPLCILAATI